MARNPKETDLVSWRWECWIEEGILFAKLFFSHFQLVIDCKELKLSVTTTTLIIFIKYVSYNAWRMTKSSEVIDEENLFIVIEYRRFLSATYIP